MKGGSSMKQLSIGILVVFIIGMCFAINLHYHNQDLYRLKQASKIVDQKLLFEITKLKQEIKVLKANSWY